MYNFITKSTPLIIALLLGLIGVSATLISRGGEILREANHTRRRSLAISAILGALPQNLCLSSFSFDIWALTTLFSSDPKTLLLYNLTSKNSALQLMLLMHIIIYIIVLAWAGIVRNVGGAGNPPHPIFELSLGVIAIILCICFQVF